MVARHTKRYFFQHQLADRVYVLHGKLISDLPGGFQEIEI
jgi:hypothetical protein